MLRALTESPSLASLWPNRELPSAKNCPEWHAERHRGWQTLCEVGKRHLGTKSFRKVASKASSRIVAAPPPQSLLAIQASMRYPLGQRRSRWPLAENCSILSSGSARSLLLRPAKLSRSAEPTVARMYDVQTDDSRLQRSAGHPSQGLSTTRG